MISTVMISTGWIGGSALVALVANIFFMGSILIFAAKVDERIPANGQKLATECYVATAVGTVRGEGAWADGFVMVENDNKILCTVIDRRDDEVKVTGSFPTGVPNHYTKEAKWIPVKDYYAFPTKYDLAEYMKKKGKK